MNELAPNTLIYLQTLSDVAYIGRVAPEQPTPEEVMLVDALKVVTVPVPTPTPQGGLHIRMTPTFVPVNHLVGGPAPISYPLDMLMMMQPVSEKHPLGAMYIKQTSQIEIAPAGLAAKLDIVSR